MGRRVIDGFVIEEAAILCPECQAPFRTEILTESRKVSSSDIIEADLHRVFNDPELRAVMLSACPNCSFCAWTSSFKPFKIRAELLKKETQIAPCKKYALAVKWARQKKMHALDIAFIAVNGLWCAREANEPDKLWLELAIFEHERGMSITPPRPHEEGMAHLLMGELYRQHKDFEKALAQYELAAQDSSVSPVILEHQKMMCKRSQFSVAALPLKVARLYFEIEDVSDKNDKKAMDFSPESAESNAAAPAAELKDKTKDMATKVADTPANADSTSKAKEPPALPADPKREPVPKASASSTANNESSASAGPSANAGSAANTVSTAQRRSAGGSPASTPTNTEEAPEAEARPLLAAISSLFSTSTKSILDQYSAEAEAELAKAGDDLSSLSKELEKTAESVSAEAGEPPALPVSDKQEPVAREIAAEQAAFMAATGTDSAKPMNTAPVIKALSAVPSAPSSGTPASSIAPAAGSAQAAPTNYAQSSSATPSHASAAHTAPSAAGSIVSADATIPFAKAPAPGAASTPSALAPPAVPAEEEDFAPAAKRKFDEPKTVALGSLATAKKKETPNAKARPKNTADIIPQLAVAPDPEEIQRASNPRLKAIAPKPEAKPALPAESPAAKSRSGRSVTSANNGSANNASANNAASGSAGGSPASTAASSAAKEEPVIRSRASVITAPPSSSVSVSVTSIAAPQAAKQESPVPILAEPERKVKKKRIKPPREDHHFVRHPVVLNTRPNENGWFNDYGNGAVATAPAAQSVREERVETRQRPSERQSERHAQKQQQQVQPHEAAASEAGAPLPGLAIDDSHRRDYSDAINRVESYLSLSRRIQSRNWMKL